VFKVILTILGFESEVFSATTRLPGFGGMLIDLCLAPTTQANPGVASIDSYPINAQ